MKVKIYKSLDKPSSFLGLKGSYALYAGVGVLIALCIAGYVSTFSNGLVGILAFVGLSVVAYLLVLRVQASFTERELKKYLSGKRLPDFIEVHPEKMRKYIQEETTGKEK